MSEYTYLLNRFFAATTSLSILALGQLNFANESSEVFVGFERDAADSIEFLDRLNKTQPVNEEESYLQLTLMGPKGKSPEEKPRLKSFLTHDPFNPPYEISLEALTYPKPKNTGSWELVKSGTIFRFRGQEPVLRWYTSGAESQAVCAVQFIDDSQVEYRIRTFSSIDQAQNEGYIVTHHNHCGSCSSLQNLGIYLKVEDMTVEARQCGKKRGAKAVKSCLIESMGLQERCAEAWTYNSQHTRKHCADICIKHYGLWKLLRNKVDKPHTDEEGNLNPCLACDESVSGAGFKYLAGRTRRNSGIVSEIFRNEEELMPVNHALYFK